MNKPIPALDENGDFIRGTLRKGGTVTIFTLNDGTGDEYPIVSDAGSHCSEDFLDIDKLRATVERAQRKREAEAKELNYDGSKWHEYTDCPKQTGCEYCLRARPTFAEALQAEASDAGDFRLMHMIERARRASEGE